MVKPEMMLALDGPLPTDDESALKQQRTRPSPRRIGAAPYPKRRDPPWTCHRMQSRATRGRRRTWPALRAHESERLASVVAAYHGARAEPQLPQTESPRLSPRAAQLSPYTSMQAKSDASLSPQSVMLLSPDLRKRIGLCEQACVFWCLRRLQS